MTARPPLRQRKRSRSSTDDCDECLPISKRINNLSIGHSMENWGQIEEDSRPEAFNNNLPGAAPCCPDAGHLVANDVNRVTYAAGNSGNPDPAWTPPSPQDSPPPIPAAHNPLLAGAQGINPRASGGLGVDMNHNDTPRAATSRIIDPRDDCFSIENRYQPELNESENPQYFQVNGLLYQAHLSRLHRCREINDRL